MSRRRRVHRKREQKRTEARKLASALLGRRAIIIFVLLLGLSAVAASAMLAKSQNERAAKRASGALAPQISGTVSKEYIYAGGRLIATEEP